MSTFLELCQLHAQEMGLDSGYPASVDNQEGDLARIVQDIRTANLQIQEIHHDWNFLHKTDFSAATAASSNALSISVPASSSTIKTYDEDSFWLDKTSANGHMLEWVPYETWRDSLNVGPQTNDEPNSITQLPSGALRVYPQADAVYTVTCDYWRTGVDFSASGGGTENSVIPAAYHRLIVVFAQILYATRKDAPEIMAAAVAERKWLLDRLESHQLHGQQDRYRNNLTPKRARPR